MNIKILLLLIMYAVLNVAAQTFNKHALNHTKVNLSLGSLQSLFTNYYIISGIFLQMLAMVLWFFVLDKIKLSIAMPLVYGVTFILLIPSSYLVLGEKVAFREILGIVIIFLGIVVLSHKS